MKGVLMFSGLLGGAALLIGLAFWFDELKRVRRALRLREWHPPKLGWTDLFASWLNEREDRRRRRRRVLMPNQLRLNGDDTQ